MNFDSLIPILALLLSIGGPVAVVMLVLLHMHRQNMAVRRIVADAVASGRSPSEIREIVDAISPQERTKGKGSLKTGIILTAVGLAIALVAPITGELEALGGAAFILFLGLAFLVIWRFVDRPGGGAC
jgi:hypothetical protein